MIFKISSLHICLHSQAIWRKFELHLKTTCLNTMTNLALALASSKMIFVISLAHPTIHAFNHPLISLLIPIRDSKIKMPDSPFWAAAPKGRCFVECRGYFVRTYVRTSVLSGPLAQASWTRPRPPGLGLLAQPPGPGPGPPA